MYFMNNIDFTDRATWLIIGGSPCASDYCDLHTDYVISAGPGIELRRPDVYMLAERKEVFRWYDRILDMRREGGILVTQSFISDYLLTHSNDYGRLTPWPDHIDENLKPGNDPLPFDEVIKVHPRPKSQWESWHSWTKGDICASISGCMAMMYALLWGAVILQLVGMEGYDGTNDYFNSMPSSHRTSNHFIEYVIPLLRKIFRTHDKVTFNLYGNPRFDTSEFENVKLQASTGVFAEVTGSRVSGGKGT